jgi:serine protease Do
VEVTLTDGKKVYGRTLGRNRVLDTGLIQIDGDRTDWPFCDLASGANVKSATQVGDWCLSLGHPGGYQEGRTAPVRLGRIIVLMHRLMQTDCELVGGDSGGPLFNMRGEVIGINSRIGAGLDFNFHVPTRAFQQEWDRLTQSRDLEGTEDLDGDGRHGALLGLSGESDTAGLKITKVYEGEPAAWAGVRVGDLLVTLDAKRITSMSQLIEQVGDKLPGDEVQIELLRDGKKIELTIELDLKWD